MTFDSLEIETSDYVIQMVLSYCKSLNVEMETIFFYELTLPSLFKEAHGVFEKTLRITHHYIWVCN